MIEKNPDSFSDIVDRAAAELRSTPVPPGPPPKLLEALLQAAKESEGPLQAAVQASARSLTRCPDNRPLSQIQKIRNTVMKYPIRSLSIFAACGSALIAALLIISPQMKGNVAFAEVCAIIQRSQTMVCTGQMNVPMPGATDTTKVKIMSLEDGRLREEIGSQMVMIVDWPTGKMLTLSPGVKSAILISFKGMPKQPMQPMQQDFLAGLKKLTQSPNAEDLGLKTVDGKEVKGFRVKNENLTVTFWADPKSGDPITVEYQQEIPNFNKDIQHHLDKEIKEMPESLQKEIQQKQADSLGKEGKGDKTMIMVLSNFQFDVPLEDSLFSLTPPEGYQLQEMSMDWSGSSEKDVIEVLRRAADMDNGQFPDSITSQKLILKLSLKSTMKWSFEMGKQAAQAAVQAAKDKAAGKEPQNASAPMVPPEMLKEQSEMGSLIGRMTTFLSENGGWKYAGKGVKIGDAQTPIFWYIPKAAKQGRVIYGDLSVKDVPLDQLPPNPEAKKSDSK
jgi:outer membrane lipoprotein-sorting protein